MTVKQISEEITRRGWHTAQSSGTYFLQDETGCTIEHAPSLIGLIEKIYELLKNEKA